MGSSGDTFNRRESLRTQLSQSCGLNRELISRRLLVMLGKEFGFNIGEENETDREALPADVLTLPPRDLIPGVLIEGRDAVVIAPPGCLKTTIATMIGVYVTGGRRVPLATDDNVPKGRVIYIASDGGESAIPTVKSYASRVGVPIDHSKYWIFAGAHAAKKQSSWSYCFRDLKWLVEQLETHKNSDMPVRLIVIDTLRAVMDLAGLDSGIGPMNEAMRLMQGIAARYNAAVLWLHHTVKSNENVAAGHASITEIPNSVHFIHPTKRESDSSPVFEWEVRKHRNAPKRVITYAVRNERGMELLTSDTSADVQKLILLEMYRELKDGSGPKNLSMYLAEHELSQSRVTKELGAMRTPKGGKLVRYGKGRWWLTVDGARIGRKLAKEEEELLAMQDKEMDTSAEDVPVLGPKQREAMSEYKEDYHDKTLEDFYEEKEREEQAEYEAMLVEADKNASAVRKQLAEEEEFWSLTPEQKQAADEARYQAEVAVHKEEVERRTEVTDDGEVIIDVTDLKIPQRSDAA